MEGTMIRTATVVLALLLLAGCMGRTGEQRFVEAQNACTGYGFKAGTDAYAQCMMQLDIVMVEQDQASRDRFARSMQQLAANNRSVTCNSTGSAYGSGNYVYGNSSTTCR